LAIKASACSSPYSVAAASSRATMQGTALERGEFIAYKRTAGNLLYAGDNVAPPFATGNS
jgi:hypothetical protein